MSHENVSKPDYQNIESKVHQTANNVQNDSLRSPVITANQLYTSSSLWSTLSTACKVAVLNPSNGRHVVICSDCVLLNLTNYYPKYKFTFRNPTYYMVGRDSSVGIATPYGLDGPEFESQWGAPIQSGPEAHPASCKMGTGSFPGVKRPGRGVDQPSPSSAEVKEIVQLYLCSPSGFARPVTG